ncbi:hypothetical protein V5799_033191 [Amblyomma americanum]|uniref:Peptidase S54 rhomboid domain-containing protein n=1 Tax=Amblyomma americanum TaxID=6943 RepID=A0AAQ4DP12_AMBAM
MAWPKRAALSLHRRVRDLWGVGFLLARMLLEVGPRGIPPVTAAAAMLQVVIYCRLLPVPWRSPWDVCMSVSTVLWRRQWRRLILSQLEHADSWHLYGNMTSFVWKGIRLEREMGSVRFARVLLVFLVEVGAVSLLLMSNFGSLLYGDISYLVCSIGFSGVLKNMEWNQDKALPAWLVWLEVVFIHVVAPQSSLLGHMAGVLVGFAYVYGVSLSSSLITPTFVATLVSGLILALRAPALPPSWTATLHAPCLSADLVFNRGHWELLLLSPLHAPSDLHAAYVVCSLLFLGSRYERYIGPVKFAIRMLAITLATGFVYCLSAWMILPSSLLGTWSVDGVHPYEVPYKCFTGCTAALLALKVRY